MNKPIKAVSEWKTFKIDEGPYKLFLKAEETGALLVTSPLVEFLDANAKEFIALTESGTSYILGKDKELLEESDESFVRSYIGSGGFVSATTVVV